MGGIFISYRRDDSRHAAGRLWDRLQQAYGPEQLFMDVDNVAPGLDFVRVLSEQVAACAAMLVIIGPNWLDVRDEDGARRLDNPYDFVRIEIEAALARDVRVIPVLVDGARIPRDDVLPEALRPLARRQAVRLTHEQFGADASQLVEALRDVVQPSGGGVRSARVTMPEPTGRAPHRLQQSERPARAAPGNALRHWWSGSRVTFRFDGSGQEESFLLPDDKSDKVTIREALNKARDFGRRNGASVGQLEAIRKAFTDKGYHLTRG
jgi:hypothetical protein